MLKAKVQKFSCNKCPNEKSNIFSKMFRHLENHHQDTKNCIFCNKNFETRIHMLDHLKTHGKGMYCKEHFLAFENYQEFLRHVQVAGHDLECGICQKLCKSRNARDTHRLTHFNTGSEPLKKGEFKCSQCLTVYNYETSLKRHIRTFHQNRKFLCEDCGASFTTNFILRRHVAKAHKKGTWPDSQGPNHCCEFCGKIFAVKHNWIAHKVKKHLKEGEFCSYCYEMFDCKEQLEEHVNALNHHLFKCTTCKATYKTKEIFLKHVSKHASSNVSAAEITKKPRRPRNLKKPLNRKYPYKIVDGKKQYECQICQKISPSISNFARHLELHSGFKKYTCDKCGKAFSQYVGLKAHFSVHSNERPYKCQTCGNGYKDLRNLIKHRRTHEKNDSGENSLSTKKRKYQKRIKSAESTSRASINTGQKNVEFVESGESDKLTFVEHFLNSDLDTNGPNLK